MDDIIVKFIIELYSPTVDKVWECITLREFLFDYAPIEEIYFYLYSRYLLFRGP